MISTETGRGNSPHNRLLALSLSAWKLVAKMTQEGRSPDKIQKMQNLAQELEDMSGEECTCVLPEQSCDVCRMHAELTYEENDYGI